MNSKPRHYLAAAAVVVVASGALAPAASATSRDPDVIFEWNQLAQESISGQPFAQVRSYAMLHVAMADAVIAIEGRYEPWHAQVRAPHGASAEAAAAQAARDVLVSLLPARQADFDARLQARLATIPPGRRLLGVQVGKAVAAKIIAWRANDGFAAANPQPGNFGVSTLPGIWRQTVSGPVQYTDLGIVEPFGLESLTQFLPAAPPQLESARYAADLNDVKSVGRIDSGTRTADQRRLSLHFAGVGTQTNVFRLWHNVARDVARAERLSLVETARLYALLTASINDSLHTAHTSKFVYRLWRPETAIAAADIDNNAATDAEAGWVPLLVTPPYPSHASNMSCIGTGAARMLANAFGSDAKSFTATWYSTTTPVTVVGEQPYTSFSQMGRDEGSSRVWGGIHFRFEIDASEHACTQVADYLYDNYMQPRHGIRH